MAASRHRGAAGVTRLDRTGLVLAGGRSTRFLGGDKALATLGGRPLVCHAAAAVAPAVDELVVNCRSDQRDDLTAALVGVDDAPVRFAVDPVPDEGPVAGLLTGLRHARGRYTAVVGCDQPCLRTATLAGLFDRAAGTAGAVPTVDGRRAALGGVYRTAAARRAAETSLARGSNTLRDVVRGLDPTGVPAPPAFVDDVDTLPDLLALDPLDDRLATDPSTATDDHATTSADRQRTDASRSGSDRP